VYEYHRAWEAANPGYFAARSKSWRAAHPGRNAECCKAFQARKRRQAAAVEKIYDGIEKWEHAVRVAEVSAEARAQR